MKLFGMLAGAALLLVLAGMFPSAESANSAEPFEIVVHEGDTLWQIAKQHYGGSDDIRKTVNEIKAYNGLSDSTLHPGQTLLLPE